MLSDKTLRNLIENEELIVENIDDLSTQLQPGGIDVRLGYDYIHKPTEQVINATNTDPLVFEPKTLYLVHTIERFELPDNIQAQINSRATLEQKGLHVTGGIIDPGFHGVLVFTIYNRSEDQLRLKPEHPVAQITFNQLDRPAQESYDEKEEAQYQDQKGL